MKKNHSHLICISVVTFLVVLLSTSKSYTQTVPNATKIKSFYFETGGVYYNFRDEISSNLSYGGLGGGRAGVGYHLFKHKNIHHDVNLFFEYGNSKYRKIPNEDYATIYHLSGVYSFFWQKPMSTKNRSWSYGGSVRSDALYIVYPFLLGNNGDTYSIDLLALGPNFGLTYPLRKSKIDFFGSVDLIGWNVRPQSYNGVSAEKTFSESRLTGITNNFGLSFKTAYTIGLSKGNSLELSYDWYYRKNTSTINALNYAQHNLNLRIYLKRKTRNENH